MALGQSYNEAEPPDLGDAGSPAADGSPLSPRGRDSATGKGRARGASPGRLIPAKMRPRGAVSSSCCG